MKYIKRSLPYNLSLAFLKPEIASQWHPTKNINLSPESLRVSSGKKVWWVCDKGHEWEATIDKRTGRGNNCPYCSGQKVLKGFNDLASTDPELVSLWHPKNVNGLSPYTVTRNSNKIIWWVCDKGHEWERKISKQTIQGSKCPFCNGRKLLTGFNDLSTSFPNIAFQWHPTKNNGFLPEEITKGADIKAWWVCDKGHEWEAYVYSRTANHGCPKCFNFSSKAENELQTWIKEYFPSAQFNIKGLLPNKKYELDIFIPEKKIAIEYNGVYWHSEAAGKRANYHYDKWLTCQEKGIQLFQIWEDDYKKDPELIKQMLLHKLGKSEFRKISGKKTKIVDLNQKETKIFLEKHHIQGYVAGSIRIGLVEKTTNKLVAVMVFKKEPTKNGTALNLLRFATSSIVQGGFTKLLTHVENLIEPDLIITFSDNCVSDGGLYRNNGFTADRTLKPDYMYVVEATRQHKFNYRLKRFKNDSMLKYEEGLTERELAALNNIPRIWDAGKTKWVKNYDV